MKKLLVLGTSNGSRAIVNYAKSKGYHTIVTDYLPPKDSAAKLISDEYWMLSTNDLEALEKKCREEKIDGVISGASDFNAEMAILLCKRLGLPSYVSEETWHYSRDKQDFKAVCKKNNVPLATDYFLEDRLENIKYPVVVKPVDLSGNRGISYCHNQQELQEAVKLAQSVSKSPKLVIERMLEGEEWYATYALAQGEVKLLALNTMLSEPGEPKNCYTITTTVTNNVQRFLDEVNEPIINVLKQIGAREGICWVQVMLDKDGHFYVIEMGYRLDGDMMFIPHNDVCGFDSIKWITDYSLGIQNKKEDLPLPQTKAFKKCGCSFMLWTNKTGTLSKIEGLDVLEKNPDFMVESFCKIGKKIDKYKCLGDVLFTAENCEELCKKIEIVNNTVRMLNENGEDVVIKYTDFEYLKKIYLEGLEGK